MKKKYHSDNFFVTVALSKTKNKTKQKNLAEHGFMLVGIMITHIVQRTFFVI